MYIGIITMLKDTVEAVNIEANTADEATTILADYVYRNYNQQVPQGGYYYVGVVIDPSNLRTIGDTIQIEHQIPQFC